MQRKPAGMNQRQTQLARDRLAQVLFARRERQGRPVLTIRQLGQPIALAMHPQQPFEPVVVGSQIGAADRPAGAEAVAFAGPEFQIRQPQRDAAPGQALAAHLAAPSPQERRVGRRAVGVKPLVNEQIGVVLPVAGMIRLQAPPPVRQPGEALQAVQRFTVAQLLGADLRTGLKDQHPQPRLGQNHRGDPTGGPCAHHHGVEGGVAAGHRQKKTRQSRERRIWWRGADLNHRPSGYEPDELPGCSTPRHLRNHTRWGPGDP